MTPSSVRHVTDRQTVQVLLDTSVLVCLEPLLSEECSVAQVARRVGTTVRAVHYRVQRLLACGLISITREEKRAGRAVKYYRAAASAFYVPFTATEHDEVEGLWLALTSPLYVNLIRSLAWSARCSGNGPELGGVHISVDGRGSINVDLGPERSHTTQQLNRPALLEWEELRLSEAQAAELTLKLKALLSTYTTECGPTTYLLGIGLSVLSPALPDLWQFGSSATPTSSLSPRSGSTGSLRRK